MLVTGHSLQLSGRMFGYCNQFPASTLPLNEVFVPYAALLRVKVPITSPPKPDERRFERQADCLGTEAVSDFTFLRRLL